MGDQPQTTMLHATAPDGTRLFFETLGEGPPLLLISGQAFDHHMWDGVREDFAPFHRVIVYDHRGIGRSHHPDQPAPLDWSTRGFAQDAIAILDALGLPDAHVYGFSMGGRIAQWLAIDHPTRVRSLVLGATTPGNAHGARRPASTDTVLASGDATGLMDLMVSRAWRARHPEWLAMMAERACHPMPPQAQRQHYLASEGHDAWALLPTIAAPTLVIHGTADLINPCANAALLASRIPGARQHLLEGVRHGYFWEAREEASAVVLDFLKTQDRSAFSGI
jgi:pimeloyl-ACP methyl ester carboxylesterase